MFGSLLRLHVIASAYPSRCCARGWGWTPRCGRSSGGTNCLTLLV